MSGWHLEHRHKTKVATNFPFCVSWSFVTFASHPAGITQQQNKITIRLQLACIKFTFNTRNSPMTLDLDFIRPCSRRSHTYIHKYKKKDKGIDVGNGTVPQCAFTYIFMVCVHQHVWLHIYLYICMSIHIYIFGYTYVHTFTCTHVSMNEL